MASPAKYSISYSFDGFQMGAPATPLPAPFLDNELANIQTSNNEIVDAINDVRKADGTLVNGIVTRDSLDAGLEADLTGGSAASAAAAAGSAVAAAASATTASAAETAVLAVSDNLPDWQGAWATATDYEQGDLFRQNGTSYITLTDHTSGVFSTDLVAGLFEIFASAGAAGPGTGDMLGANDLSDVASAATSRANLGLGAMATQNPASVTITGGVISGITDIAIADGGTGASTAAAALVNFGFAATVQEINLLRALPLTTGTSAAFVADTGLGLTALTPGAILTIRFHVLNEAGATMAVDSVGVLAIHVYRRDGLLTAVKKGQIQAGATITLRYNGTEFTVLGGQGYRAQEETLFVRKQIDQTKNSDVTTVVDDELRLNAPHPGIYGFEAQIVHSAGAGALKGRIANPSFGTLGYQVNNGPTAYDGTANFIDSDTSAVDRRTTIRGTVVVTAPTGVQFFWAQNVSDVADTIVKAGSTLELIYKGES